MSVAKTRVLFRSVAAGALAAAAFTSQAEAASIRMMFQGDPYEIDAISDAAKRFEAANPGTTIELIHTPHDSYNEKIGAAVSAKQLPDLLELDAPFLSNYVWSGFLQPIDTLIDKKLLDDMTPSNISQGTYPPDKKLYATSLIDSTVVLYASKKQLEALKNPHSQGRRRRLDERRVRGRAQDAVDPAWRQVADRPVPRLWHQDGMAALRLRADLGLLGLRSHQSRHLEGFRHLDGKACVDAMTMMGQWNKNGWVVPQSAGGNQFYAEGRPAALAWGGFWFYAEAQKTMGDDLIVLPLPKFGAKSASPNGTWIYAISKTSSDPQMAGKFLSFMIEDQKYQDAYRAHAGFPGLKSFGAASPDYAPGGAMAVAFEQAAKSAVPRPLHPAYPAITLAAQVAINNIFDGADPQTELTKAAKAIDADIDDNDGYPPFGKK